MNRPLDLGLVAALEPVMDPELGVSIVRLGLVREATDDGEQIYVAITTTSPSCPLGPVIQADVAEALGRAYPDRDLRIEVRNPGRSTPARGLPVITGPASPPQTGVHWARLPVLALGAIALILGLAGGLVRLGFVLPGPALSAAPLHGPLMAAAFLGTVIGAERAIALGVPWGWLAPIGFGAGGVLALLGAPVAGASMLLGAAVFVLACVRFAVISRDLPHGVMLGGGLALLAAQLGYVAGAPVGLLVPGWVLFVVLTILGERIELGRLDPDGVRARLARGGQARYVAVCVGLGWAWALGTAALTVAHWPIPMAGPLYDAALHGLFVGFVFSMIFGHAPIVLQAVVGLRLPFHPALYLPVIALHASLLVRVAGDLGLGHEVRRAGGLGNVGALLWFALTAVVLVAREVRRR